jgi:uncharacterized lipoprotein YddW (UPF0748 family)
MIEEPKSLTRFGVRGSAFLIFVFFCIVQLTAAEVPSPPPLVREFRGAWIATVGNINWPSKPGLPTDQQQAELRAILDNAVDLKLNAILFQVRPACDAVYKSDLEPWSEYITGTMGRAPEPFYDPLAYAVEQAHARGLELQAWFNPYRAGILPHKMGGVAAKHISKTRPGVVKHYGNNLWLDPGEEAVKEHTIRVILDVVRRYDIDGVHLDDYFYPYPEKDGRGNAIEFPDDASYKVYRKKGGKLDRADWRRENVNQLVERLHAGIHKTKPWVRFGISPFGIWRPGFPVDVKGLDSFERLYGDSRKWLREGWLDYCAPELYWQIAAPKQSYTSLLKWWLGENPRNRYIFPASTLSGIGKPGWPNDEIVQQINLSRTLNDHPGHILWNFNRILNNQSGIRTALAEKIYKEPALGPAFTWLDEKSPSPARPMVTLRGDLKDTVQWVPTGSKKAWLWALQTRTGDRWTTEVIPGQFNARTFKEKIPDEVCVTAIDRCGNASPPTTILMRPPVVKRVSSN